MVPIFATSTQANLLIYVGGGGFVLLGAFYFGRLVTFFFPKNPLIRRHQINQRRRTMPDVKLNSGSDDVVLKFKIIDISVSIGLNAIVFIWYFFFSGLT